ncbi:MAG: redoxin domain-containing protein [Acidimicrobiia bacterium]|nr:redoxin domain-containing protein [Acidimicrobiia bacterium]MDH3396896.1 redoxin domain-containing protein [Acidimicrobiia bacterium]MDH5615049.1 redoxin domain-containing protein [Acidimicrobiia bacterium]
MSVTAGDRAPNFELFDQDANEVSRASLEGRKSLIVFIPLPFSGICEAELCSIRDNLARLNGMDANVVVITCDTRFVHKKWATEQGFEFPLLSDFWPHGATARAYGSFNEQKGVANRVTYVLDHTGVVREIIDSGSLGVAREMDAYVEALRKI